MAAELGSHKLYCEQKNGPEYYDVMCLSHERMLSNRPWRIMLKNCSNMLCCNSSIMPKSNSIMLTLCSLVPIMPRIV